ncbi:MAG: ATP-binding protein [Marinilabiliaceae bacterium]|nr:ATP-binding protein [Marinilabiliaceae bacterium]
MKPIKKIPYCIPNFESIRTENYLYVDKTRFIEMIENESSKYHFLIRPRKFGKSLFLSVLEHYYDIRFNEQFEALFGDLYIGKNPTKKRNSYFVLKFSFSGLDTSSVEEFKTSFNSKIEACVNDFINNYEKFIEVKEFKKLKLQFIDKSTKIGVKSIEKIVFDIVKRHQGKLYVIIDEYDHFANDLIAQGTNLSMQQYKELIWANGVVRDFYETLKDGIQNLIDKIFITGITPIMLDDVTSGFNITNNLSVKEKYNEILGFTEEEVEFVRQEAGIDKNLIKVDMEFLYNGYKFHRDAKNRLYNSSMINYFFMELLDEGLKIERLMDWNLKTDYGRIKNLLQKPENIVELENIININQKNEKVIDRFSIEKLHEPKNFLSLLYYMGLVTIEKEDDITLLKIPNYTIKTMYWEYMENIILERNPEMSYNPSLIREGLTSLAYDGEYEHFFENFQQKFVSQLSNQDLKNFTEKHIKLLLLSILWQSNYYIPISEQENSKGYTDIYLQRRSFLYPRIKIDWIWELKYIKESEVRKKSILETKKKEAKEQLKRYKTSNLYKDRNDVRYIAIVFIGKKKVWIEEI